MTVRPAHVSSERVPIDLSSFSKVQSDLVRMALLLEYGHQQLVLAPDGSSITVETRGGQRPIDVRTFVSQVAEEAT